MSDDDNNRRGRLDSENEDDPDPFESSGDEWDIEQAKREASGRRKSARIGRKTQKQKASESESEVEDEDEARRTVSDEEDDYFSEDDRKKRKKSSIGKNCKIDKKSSFKRQKMANDSDDPSDDTNKKDSGVGGGGGGNNHQKDLESEDSDSASSANQNRRRRPQQHQHQQRKFIPKTIYSEDYATGSFVILKKDAQNGAEKYPVIWRIDGKALLQKYEAFNDSDVAKSTQKKDDQDDEKREEKILHKNTSIYTGWSPLDKDLYAPITVDVIRHSNNNLTVEVQWDQLKSINVDSD